MADAILKPTHGQFQDISGRKYGYLTVVEFAGVSNGKSRHYYWLCMCVCGKPSRVESGHLKSGHTTSCGCQKAALVSKRITRHGECRSDALRTAEHATWGSMLQRCLDPSAKSYHHYGGRGIRVCERWMTFENFLADMGRRPSAKHSIDRIDNDGNYEPSNCRWATRREQRLNKRDSIYVEFRGERSSLFELCEKHSLPYNTVWQRINTLGWPVDRSLTERVRRAKQT